MRDVARLALAGALLAGTGAAAEDAVELRANTRVAVAPADLLVTVTVPPDAANRSLTVEADSGEYLTSSTVQLDGDREVPKHQFWMKRLPSGKYVVVATVAGADGVRGSATIDVEVVAGR